MGETLVGCYHFRCSKCFYLTGLLVLDTFVAVMAWCTNCELFSSSCSAVLCKLAGSSYWKGENDDTYDPRKIWWYNFFHFGWHLFANIAVYNGTYDLCHNGLRGVT